MQNTPVSPSSEFEPGDINVVEMWTTFDLPRTVAGLFAGVFAGIVAWSVAGLLAASHGSEFWYPWKVAASPILGNTALNSGLILLPIVLGFIVSSIICGVLGAVYGHFTKTNKWLPLLGAGFMWGTFSWIFILNLFSKSFLEIRTEELPAGVGFFVLLIFGFSLVSIRVFDRIICGRDR